MRNQAGAGAISRPLLVPSARANRSGACPSQYVRIGARVLRTEGGSIGAESEAGDRRRALSVGRVRFRLRWPTLLNLRR